jgi:hypothetical protein
MSKRTTDPVADIDLLAAWEGPAEHAPGVLFEESAGKDMLSGKIPLTELAAWVAVTAISGVTGNANCEAIKAKVIGVLAAWRHDKGQDQFDQLKQQVFAEMQKHRTNGKLTEEELKKRIDTLFADVRG